MSLIIDTVQTFLPPKRKQTPSGWISFDAVCCHHSGQTADRRKRGGIMITEGVSYHCFNCGFKASWQPGRTVSTKFKKLLNWLNVPTDQINKCVLEALRDRDSSSTNAEYLLPKFIEKQFPPGTRSLDQWLVEDPDRVVPVLEYLINRGFDLNDYNWCWTDQEGFDNRLIIPFYYQKRLVGWTARLLRDGKVKYISEQQPGYVFNLDNQDYNRKFAIVTEGPLDAISLDACAAMTNELSSQQILLLRQLNKEIIVVPDRDSAGLKMAAQAADIGFSVSFPDWPEGVKDINDAVKKLGKLSVMKHIVDSKETTALKIQLKIKSWVN